MTEKQLFYPLLSVYFSLILGDLQKEKLQIVSIFRFGHKKRGLFQCPPKGRECNDKPLSGFPKKGNWGGAFCDQHRSPIPAFPKGKDPFKHTKTQQVEIPTPWGGPERGHPSAAATL